MWTERELLLLGTACYCFTVDVVDVAAVAGLAVADMAGLAVVDMAGLAVVDMAGLAVLDMAQLAGTHSVVAHMVLAVAVVLVLLVLVEIMVLLWLMVMESSLQLHPQLYKLEDYLIQDYQNCAGAFHLDSH